MVSNLLDTLTTVGLVAEIDRWCSLCLKKIRETLASSVPDYLKCPESALPPPSTYGPCVSWWTTWPKGLHSMKKSPL